MRTLAFFCALLLAAGAVQAQNTGTASTTFTVDSGASSTSTDALVFGGTGESLVGTADATFTLTRNTAGTVTLNSADNNSDADLTIDAGGTGTLTLGSSGDAVVFGGTAGLGLANSETINTGTDAVFDFTRNDAGTVTLTASDDNAVAALAVLPGGAAALTLGGASTTSVTVTTDGAGFGIDTTAETATLTATSTNTAVYTGADAAGAANTTYDTTGAGAIQIGSADVTSVTVVADGGTAVLDGASSVLQIGSGADPGATCTVGTIYLDTDETVDTNCTTTGDNSLCLCVATNTWAQLNNN